jgi:hypothetical protein
MTAWTVCTRTARSSPNAVAAVGTDDERFEEGLSLMIAGLLARVSAKDMVQGPGAPGDNRSSARRSRYRSEATTDVVDAGATPTSWASPS